MRKFVALLLIGIGFAGAVLFLPLNNRSRNSCLFRKILFPNQRIEFAPRAEIRAEHRHHQEMKTVGSHSIEDQELLAQYLIPYGLFWWGSLLMLGFGTYHCYKEFKHQRNTIRRKIAGK